MITTKSAWMFPGQGGQNQEMLWDVPLIYFKLIKERTGLDYLRDSPNFSQTIDIQLMLLVTEISNAKALQAKGIQPDIVAGHSLGAFSAAVIAGVLDLKSAIELVYHRASLMQSLFPHNYGMGVVNGLKQQELQVIAENHFIPDKPVYVSNQNEVLQLTISGHWDTIDQVLKSAKAAGAGFAKRLDIPTPSHSPLMLPVSVKLYEVAEKMLFHDPTCAYLGNCTGRLLETSEEIKEDLINNVTLAVRWLDMMQVAIENGVEIFIEMPPGNTLAKLVQRAYSEVHTFAIEQHGIADTAFLYQKWSK